MTDVDRRALTETDNYYRLFNRSIDYKLITVANILSGFVKTSIPWIHLTDTFKAVFRVTARSSDAAPHPPNIFNQTRQEKMILKYLINI